MATSSQYDICLLETLFYSTIEIDEKRGNKKRGGVCMHYKDYLPIIRRDDLCTLQECLLVEIKSWNCFFICLFRSQVKTRTALY